VKINVYLPDDIGEFAKGAKLNLSGLLRQAVIAEQRRMAAAKALGKQAEEFDLMLESAEGERYVGVLKGKQLTEDRREQTVYQTTDGRVMVYDEPSLSIREIKEAGDAKDWGFVQDYIAVCAALGQDARIEV
jgi:post-segregation antitoxin (ccd killing protein)